MCLYLLKHLAGLVVVLLVMSFFVFCLQSIIPSDPARAVAGPAAPTAVVETVRKQLGLDQPVIVQYGRFLLRLARGDLGTSFRTRQPITADIGRHLPATLELMTVAVFLGVAPAAGLALLRSSSPRSGFLRVAVIGLGSMPIFLSALLLVYVFWFKLKWLPGSGRLGLPDFSGPTGFILVDGFLTGQPSVSLDAFAHILLPSIALALPIAVAIGRTMSSALHDVMQQAYIRAARGKGISETRLVFALCIGKRYDGAVDFRCCLPLTPDCRSHSRGNDAATRRIDRPNRPDTACQHAPFLSRQGRSLRLAVQAHHGFPIHPDRHLGACERSRCQVKLSLSHFARAFTIRLGLSPYSFIMKLRIERASALLFTSNKSLAEVDFNCGLSDHAHFSRLFRRFVGMTPTQ